MNDYELRAKFNNMKTNYMPPRSLQARLAHIGLKRKRVAIGVGIRRWALNSMDATRRGTAWALHYCNIKTYFAHKFFSYKVNSIIRDDIEVLERVATHEEMGKCPVSNEEIIDGILMGIVESGASEILLEATDKFPRYDIIRASEEARRWMWSNDGISTLYAHTRWGSLMRHGSEAGDALFRYSMSGGSHFIDPYDSIRKGKLDITPKSLTECTGCSMSLPCVAPREYANGELLCHHCSNELVDEGLNPCKHAECGIVDCAHFVDTPVNEQFDFIDDNNEDFDWSDDMEHDFEF
jgi:hypothetical protein